MLSHFKGHAMAGFGGAIKNISIGFGSSMGKVWIHSGGTKTSGGIWGDLNWQDRHSRSSIEMNDRSARPEIDSRVQNMAQYDIVFVGFPVWWYREPSIIDTFMEQYDFSGKTVIPFATSGGSQLGDSGKNMQALANGAKLEAGRRFSANASEKELADWASRWL